MLLENRIPIRQVHQFRCVKARATTERYAKKPEMFGNNDPLKKLLILQAIGPSENPSL